jgi:hypothetical protein
MASQKLTGLTQITLPPQPTDQLYIVRPSEGLAGSHSILYGSLFAGVGRAILPNITVVGTVGNTPTQLHALLLDPGTFKTDGDYARIEMAGGVANNANAKQFSPGVIGGGGGPVFEIPAVPINSGGFGNAAGWGAFFKFVRISPTGARLTFSVIFAQSIFNASGANLTLGHIVNSQTFTDDVNFDFNVQQVGVNIVGTGVADNDITQNLTTCEIYNF